jgi:hypothetical protein
LAGEIDHRRDRIEWDSTVAVRKQFTMRRLEAQRSAQALGIDTQDHEPGSPSEEAARRAQNLLARGAVDEAFALEAVRFVGTRLERCGKRAALGDVKYVARDNPFAWRGARYSAAVTSDLVLS